MYSVMKPETFEHLPIVLLKHCVWQGETKAVGVAMIYWTVSYFLCFKYGALIVTI